jgi:hypothetical protein
MPPPSLKDLTGRIAPTPVFFIHAEHGQGGEELNPKYYAAARESKTIWRIAEGKHTVRQAQCPVVGLVASRTVPVSAVGVTSGARRPGFGRGRLADFRQGQRCAIS